VVCTANRCRSPMAAAFLRSELAARHSPIIVLSAGFLDSGVPAPEPILEAMQSVGIDVSDHRSVSVDRDLATGADLIIGMARQHVIDLVTEVPEVWPRSFTAAELLRRARHIGPPRDRESLRAWAERLSAGRERTDLLGEKVADDVPDPIGGSRRDYERVRDLLAGWAAELGGLLVGDSSK
jgi:protein-tyrosine phosphatase